MTVGIASATYVPPFTGGVKRGIVGKISENVSAADFGAVGDGININGTASISSGSAALTVTGANFQTTDVGKTIAVSGAGATNGVLFSTISARSSTTAVTLANNATATTSTGNVWYGTDNTTALTNLQAWCAGSGKPHYNIALPTGMMCHKYNRFLLNIVSFTLYAKDCIIMNLTDTVSDRLRAALFMGSMHELNPILGTTDNFIVPPKFNNATFGDTAITLTTAGDVATFGFVKGSRVFLYSHCKQLTGGFPPNAAFFEWNEVESLGGSGVLNLCNPVRHTYYNDTYDTPGDASHPAIGKPRAINLDRSDYIFPRRAEIIGGDWRTHTTTPAYNSYFMVTADYARIQDATIWGLAFASMSRVTEFQRCRLMSDIEPDKLAGRATFNDCWIKGIVTGATGIERIEFINCTLGGNIQSSADETYSSGNTILTDGITTSFGVITNYTGFGAGKFTSVDDKFATDQQFPFVFSGGAEQTLPTLAAGNINASGHFLFNETTDAAAIPNLFAWIRPGTVMYKSDLTKRGTVTRMSYTSPNFIIEGTFDPIPVAGETWNFYLVAGPATIDRPLFPNVVSQLYRNMVPHVVGPRLQNHPTVLVHSSRHHYGTFSNILDVKGYVRAIRVRIDKRYRGSTSGVLLKIVLDAANMIWIDPNVDGNAAGLTTAGGYKQTATDYLGELPATPVSTVTISLGDGAGTVPAATRPGLQAVWQIEFELESLC